MKSTGTTSFEALEGWKFTPEGAVIHADERTAVIADVHLGYEWARGHAGDCVPAHSLNETLARLDRLLARDPVERLIVAGDLVESARPCCRTADDLDGLRSWLDGRRVELMVLEGNHDRRPLARSRRTIASTCALAASATAIVAGWTIGHGHVPVPGHRVISGHHHPVLRFGGHTAPCYLIGPDRIVLPAFSLNAAGCDVLTAALPRDWDLSPLRCVVSTGQDVLDFGPLIDLRRVLGARRR